jgi:hypothetical protein
MNKKHKKEWDKFWKKARVLNKNIPKETELKNKEHDCGLRNAPLRTFQVTNKELKKGYKYSFKKHLDRIYENFKRKDAKFIIAKVDDINSFALAKPY